MSKNKNFSSIAASRYSLALYELAEENKHVQEIESQSFAFIKLLNELSGSVAAALGAIMLVWASTPLK